MSVIPPVAPTARAAAAVGVGVAQFAPTADPSANLAEIARLTGLAASRGAGVVVFPEYSSYFVDPFDETLRRHAEDVDGPFTRGLTAVARTHGVVVVAGLLERAADGERVRNTVVAVGENGVLARYRKVHLYDAFGQRESDWVEPGATEPPQTFDAAGLTFGMMTCYDLRFPESARVLADAGCDVIVVPSEWVRGPGKEHQWRTLLAARAIENTLFVAAADHPPPLGVGHSAILDPRGVEIAAVGAGTDVAVAHLDAELLSGVRRINPSLGLRRYAVIARDTPLRA